MEDQIVVNLGKTIIHGDIPCSCITVEQDNVKILIQEGLDYLASCETVCPHGNYFVVVKAGEKAPFVEPSENKLKARIWINVHKITKE